jgi:lysozyme family protein/peptidoglycan hydrolase-like protein with peptidoglycan-binding domain
MAIRFEDLKAEYADLWRRMQVRPERLSATDAIANRLIQSKARYQQVAVATRVPWFVVAALHQREASGRFAGVLHNGEQIIGTGRLTRLVPKGRGPFATWEASAIDALTTPPHALQYVDAWTIERACFEIERYNGFGYRLHHPGVKSPYLWSFSTQYDRGKYVADGHFDPAAIDAQCGTMPILRRLMDLDPSIRLETGTAAPDLPPSALGMGSIGAAVRDLQTVLTARGFPVGEIDGAFGPDTEAGVRAFQRAQNLPVTGVADRTTMQRLAATPAPSPGPLQPHNVLHALIDALRSGMPAQGKGADPGDPSDVLRHVFGAILGRQPSPTPDATAPILSPIDKALGGEALAGKKTALAIVAYAVLAILKAVGVIGAATPAGQIITVLITVFGALGGVSKVDRVIKVLAMIAAKQG